MIKYKVIDGYYIERKNKKTGGRTLLTDRIGTPIQFETREKAELVAKNWRNKHAK